MKTSLGNVELGVACELSLDGVRETRECLATDGSVIRLDGDDDSSEY